MKKLNKNRIGQEAKQVSKALMNFIFKHRRGMVIGLLFFFNVNVITPGSYGSLYSPPELSKEQIYVNTVKDNFKSKLVIEVDSLIRRMAPESKLSPDYLVDKCLEYNTDIIFVLAQGLLESHFGTKGKAAVTNSVWNVGTYDNGRVLYSYEDPNESLEPYLKLVNEKYLITVESNGDTINKNLYHLIQDKGYTNYNGKRFASAIGYENALRKLIIKINMETSINFYQEVLTLPNEQLLALFNPTMTQDSPDEYMAMR